MVLLLERLSSAGWFGGAVAVVPDPQRLLADTEPWGDRTDRCCTRTALKGLTVLDHPHGTLTQLRTERPGHTPILLAETRNKTQGASDRRCAPMAVARPSRASSLLDGRDHATPRPLLPARVVPLSSERRKRCRAVAPDHDARTRYQEEGVLRRGTSATRTRAATESRTPHQNPRIALSMAATKPGRYMETNSFALPDSMRAEAACEAAIMQIIIERAPKGVTLHLLRLGAGYHTHGSSLLI